MSYRYKPYPPFPFDKHELKFFKQRYFVTTPWQLDDGNTYYNIWDDYSKEYFLKSCVTNLEQIKIECNRLNDDNSLYTIMILNYSNNI